MTNAPHLHEDEREQQRAMAALLEARIADAGGVISFAEYVDLALYAPGLGYYVAGAHKLGEGGDFTTAPETSVLFGECVARQCAQVLGELGGGDVLELGAGTGRLACDVLAALAGEGALPARYRILEVSPELRDRQRAAVSRLPAPLAARVEWLDRLPDDAWRGVLLANEVLDALPFERLRYDADGITELAVGWDGAGPCWRERPAGATLAAEARRVAADLPGPLPAAYTTELCLRAGPWVRSVTERLARGIALFIDYGLPRSQYYHPQRDGGTLRCHYRQRAHEDPFFLPGLQDITAWVDFTRIAEAADDAGLEVLGFATQAAFLLGNGIEAMIADIDDDIRRARRVSEARQLLMPDGMGEAFKAMALGRGWNEPLSGFVVQDLRSRL